MSRFSFFSSVRHASPDNSESRALNRCHRQQSSAVCWKLAAMVVFVAMMVVAPQSSYAQGVTALANGYVGVPYSQQLSATGLGGAVTWSVTSGALPGGILLDSSTGRLAGVPVSAGDYSFTVTASQGNSSAQQALTLNVENGFGDLIAADGNNGIYRINPTTNTSSSIAFLINVLGVAADPKTGDIYAAVRLSGTIWKIDHDNGQLTQFYSGGAFSHPADVVVDQSGNVYVGDNALDAVYKLNSSGQLVDASGNPTTAAFAAMPASPTESQDVRMVFDSHGNLIVASDASVNSIRTLVIESVSPAGVVTNLFTGAAHTLGGIDFAKDGTGALIFADYQSGSLIQISDLGNSNLTKTLITSTALCCDVSGSTGAITGLAAQPGTGDPTYFVTINGSYPMKRVVPATGSVTPVTSFSYGSALGWLRSDVTQIQALTIAADSKSMTYGGSLPPLTYTVSPSVALDTVPTCSADSTDTAGAYTITCSGATKSGYQITYIRGTLTVNKAVLTVTADNKSMVAGGPVPTLTASHSGFVNGDTFPSSCPPNADVCFPAISGAPDLSTTATSASSAGTYPITVAPGTLSATNYSFNFVNGNMSVTGAVGTAITLQLSNVALNNGATLSGSVSIDLSQLNGNPVTFNNIVLTPGTSGLPPLTFNNYRVGFAADKPGYDPGYLSMWLPSTENSNYQLQLAIPYPFSTTTSIPLQIVPGNSNPYIGSGVFYCVGQGCVGGMAMYNVVTGWLDAQTTNHQQESLKFGNNYFVTGDYALGSVAFQASSDGSYATGTIAIPAGTQPNAIPDGAEVLSAFLYWQTLEDSAAPSSSGGFFNGYSITADIVSTGVQSSCFGNPGAYMRAYRTSVLPYLPVRNGALQATGSHTVRLPYAGAGLQSTQGATLVVIYRVLSPNAPLRSVVVYEGAQVIDTGTTLNQTIRGFYDSVPSGNGSPAQARYNSVRSLFSSGTNWDGTAPVFPVVAYKGESINVQENWGTPGCQVWSAVVFSTNVNNTDSDGILDAWKQGPTPPGWAPPDPHQGQPGYYDAGDGSWVALAGAAAGQKDIFVQFDYMVGADGHSHYPQAGVLSMVQNAFANRGVHVHFVQGDLIAEETCTDDLTANPPQSCVYPGEPGVVDWKWGLQGLKAAPVDAAACAQNPGSTSACAPRFQPGRKDSYHYLVFGHSLGIAAWNINDGTLQGIAVSGGVATITTTNRARSDGTYSCPTRVTIDGVLGTPALNGVYDVMADTCTPTSFAVSTNNVADGTWVSASNASAEPLVVVIPANTSTMSGYSDVAGADTAVTLGKWDTDGLRVNVQAGTVMHELGHTLALTHGGMYTPGVYPVAEPNCKPNYQSVMNYLFQIDLLSVPDTDHPYGYLDYSNQVLNTLDENQLSTIPGLTSPLYNWTKWYSPVQPGSATAASRHCDGTPINSQVEAPYYLMQGTTGNVGWSDYQNIHFGQVTADGKATAILHGYNDWNSIDLRQVSAAGNDYLRDGSGGIVRQGGTGGIVRQGGTGGIVRQGGSGGIVRQGGTGGIVRQGGTGGIVRQGGAGGIGADPEITHETANSYPHPPRSMTVNGGSVTWTAASLGNIKQYNVYRVVDGTRTLIACVPVGSAVANCSNPQPAGQFTYTDPGWGAGASYLVTTVDISDVGAVRESTPQRNDNQTITFGPIPGKINGDPDFELIASASSGLPVSFEAKGSCTVVNGNMLHITGAGSCTVTASQPGNGDTNAAIPVSQSFVIGRGTQTITFAALPNKTLGDPAFTVSATGGGSGNPVMFTAGPAAVCTSSGTNGSTITLTGVGTCTVTASQQGNANYSDAVPVQRSFAVAQYAVCSGDVGRQVLQPINSTAPYSAFKAGSTVPVKFHVCNSAGTSVGSPMKVVKAFGMVGSATSTDPVVDEAIVSATPDTAFRWDATGQQWIFNLSTKGYKAGTTYYFRIDLNDGTSISFEFKGK